MNKKVWLAGALAVVIVAVVLSVLAPRIGRPTAIQIGRILPLTGPAASRGESERKGTLLAVEEVNAVGGVDGRPLEVLFEDSRSSTEGGVKAMTKLVEADKVPAVLGATVDEVTLAVSAVANEQKVLLLSPLSSAPAITQAGPFVFRVTPSDAHQCQTLAIWMVSEGHKKVAMLYVDNAWGKGVAEGFEKAFAGVGGTMLRKEACTESGTDFRPQLTRIRDAKPSALFCPTTSREGAIIFKQMKKLEIALPIYGADNWTVDALIKGAGDDADHVKYIYSPKYTGSQYQRFAAAFQAKYGDEPDANAAAAYDAVQILARCMSVVAEEGLPLTGDNIRREMAELRNYRGATGTTTFDENGDSIARTIDKMILRAAADGHPYHTATRASTTTQAASKPK